MAEEIESGLEGVVDLEEALGIFEAHIRQKIASTSSVTKSENFAALEKIYSQFQKGEPDESAYKPKQILA